MRKLSVACILAAVVLLSGCSESKKSLLLQAEKMLNQNDYTAALEEYNKAIMEDVSLQRAYRGAGIASLMLGDSEKAEDYFLRSLKESDGIISDIEVDTSYYLAESQSRLANYKEAVKTYTNILKYDSKETDAYFLRGSVYTKLQNIEKAKKDLDKAIEMDKNNIIVYYKCYEILSQSGYAEEGKEYLQSGLDCTVNSKEDHYTRGKIYAGLGDDTKAKEELAISKQQGYSPAAFYMGVLYEQQQDYDTALTFYEEYEKIANVSMSEYQTIAECRIKKGDYAGALELYRSAMDQAEESQKKSLWFSEIVLYEKSGDFTSARAEIENYLKQYPKDEQALHEYEFLKTR